MSAAGKLDRPAGSLHLDRERVTEAQYRWFVPRAVMEEMHAGIAGSELGVLPDARHGLPCSHGAACGRALRAFLGRRAA